MPKKFIERTKARKRNAPDEVAENSPEGKTKHSELGSAGKRKKRFKIKLKSKKRGPANVLAVDTPKSGVSCEPKRFLDHLIDFVGATDLPPVRAKYAALCGSARSVDQAVASDRPLMKACADEITRSLRSRLEANPSEVRVEVMRYAVVSGEDAKISVKGVRKAASSYPWGKKDGFAWIRLSAVPRGGSAVPGVAVDLVAVTFGEIAISKFGSRRRGSRIPSAFEQGEVRSFSPEDIESLEVALHDLFSCSFTGIPDDPFNDPPLAFEEECKPGLRALITLMCRSQLPMRKMFVAFGAGKPIVTAAMAEVEHLLKEQCKSSPEILHRDAILHFWFSELRRLRLDHISVPEVQIR